MAEHPEPDDLPTPTPADAGEPDEPGESADPLTAPGTAPGDEVHGAMVEEAGGDASS